jgi:prolyl-tRNA synthetase
VSYARRDTGEKGTIPLANLATEVPELLEKIQQSLYDKANEAYKAHRLQLTEWDKVVPALNDKYVVIIPFCEEPKCEERIKELTKSVESQELGADGKLTPSMGMKSLCIPFDQVSYARNHDMGCSFSDNLVLQPSPKIEPGKTKCLNPECDNFAKSWVMFGRSY